MKTKNNIIIDNGSKNSKAGFSLVELMVVVAIIGILATIAVPNFQRFQARAKQANAKTELTAIYTAQKSYFVEHSSYTPDLQLAGFVPEGLVLDGSAGGGDITQEEIVDNARMYGSTAGTVAADGLGNAPVAPAALPGWPAALSPTNLLYADVNLIASADYAGTGGYPAKTIACGVADTAGEVQAAFGLYQAGVRQDEFLATSAGCPKGNNATAAGGEDVWIISHNRQLINAQSGI